jgi:hypothetical protein
VNEAMTDPLDLDAIEQAFWLNVPDQRRWFDRIIDELRETRRERDFLQHNHDNTIALIERLKKERDEQREELIKALIVARKNLAECRSRVERKQFPLQYNYSDQLRDRREGNTKPIHRTIPWEIAARAYNQYAAKYGTEQSLERLAERGGFGHCEMDMLYPNWREAVDEYGLLIAELRETRRELEIAMKALIYIDDNRPHDVSFAASHALAELHALKVEL